LVGWATARLHSQTPEERASELSDSSAVPTPFVVIHSIRVSDGEAAEKYIHSQLERQGLRVSSNREFFQVGLEDALQAMKQAEEKFGPPVRLAPTGETSGTVEREVRGADWPAWFVLLLVVLLFIGILTVAYLILRVLL